MDIERIVQKHAGKILLVLFILTAWLEGRP